MSRAKRGTGIHSLKKGADSASKRWPAGYVTVVNDARSVILAVVNLAFTPGSEELALRLRLLCRKIKHDVNRLIFDLQRKSSAREKARVYGRTSNVGNDT
jgi:hypothetical protein